MEAQMTVLSTGRRLLGARIAQSKRYHAEKGERIKKYDVDVLLINLFGFNIKKYI